MYKISELIGKQSITLLDAENRGVVFGAYFDKSLSRLRQLLLLSGDEEGMFLVDFKSLASIHSDAVVVKSADSIRPLTPQPSMDVLGVDSGASELYSGGFRPVAKIGGLAPCPINLPVFNQDGKSLGFIRDILMDDCLVSSFITDEGDIPAGTLLSRSEEMVVFNDTGEDIKLVRPKKAGGARTKKDSRKTVANLTFASPDSIDNFSSATAYADFVNPENVDSQSLSVATPPHLSIAMDSSVLSKGDKGKLLSDLTARLSGGKDKDSDADSASGLVADRQVGTPARVTPPGAVPPISDINLLKYAFLLGKRLSRSIYTDGGRLVARENDLVTESIIKKAKENGKLVAVALHSL